MTARVLEVRDLTRIHGRGCDRCLESTGPEHGTNICPHCRSVVAVGGVSLHVNRGEILGIMGESGSGKSSVVRLLHLDDQPSSGSALFHDEGGTVDLFALDPGHARRLRERRLGIVYQNPVLGLNLDISAGANIAERLLTFGETSYAAIRARAAELLERTEVPPARMDERPRRFSGGMQQRVQIARALATNPPLLFLDEVTTGLDLSVQARILDLILELKERLGTTMVVVTHDLGVVRLLASRTIVMKFGRVVESGLTDQILEDPQHAYTQRLVASAL